MNQKLANPELEALYARIDEMNMTPADCRNAKACLAQADALVDFILGTIGLAKRAYGALTLRPGSTLGSPSAQRPSTS